MNPVTAAVTAGTESKAHQDKPPGVFFIEGEMHMWVVFAIIILILLVGEAVFFLSDKLPWRRNKK
jgi:hypothetical protein